MPSTATVTAKVGPAQTVTAQVFNNVLAFNFDTINKVLTINNGGTILQFDINAISTITCTLSSGLYTLTVS